MQKTQISLSILRLKCCSLGCLQRSEEIPPPKRHSTAVPIYHLLLKHAVLSFKNYTESLREPWFSNAFIAFNTGCMSCLLRRVTVLSLQLDHDSYKFWFMSCKILHRSRPRIGRAQSTCAVELKVGGDVSADHRFPLVSKLLPQGQLSLFAGYCT